MNRREYENQQGFAALISTVIVSAILLAMAGAASRDSFWERFGILDRENKEISGQLARSCVDMVLLGLAKGQTTFFSEITVEGDKKCEIINIGGSNPYIITVRAKWKNSFTNLKITAELKNSEFTIKRWEEI